MMELETPVKQTILVVDDSELVRDVTSSMLRGAGFEVTEAGTGAEGLRLASARPDLIVLDVHLPDIDGREICRQIKANPETASIPVLHLSGTFREVEDRVKGLELGADGYLTKPVGKAELIATVNALLRVRKVEADLGQSEGRRRAAETMVDWSRALAQSLESGDVGERIVEGLRGLLAVQVATLYRLEPVSGDLVSVAVAGDSGPHEGPVRMPRGTGVSGLAVRDRQPVTTPDALADPRVTIDAGQRARVEQAPFRAVLALPLLVREQVIGALAVGDRAGRVFDEGDVRLARTFAAQAALALENARLYREAQERLREAEVVGDLARTLNESLDLDVVLQRLVEGARELCDCDLARIALREGDDAAVFRYLSGARYAGYARVRVEPGQGTGGQVLRSGAPFRTEDWLHDPRFGKEAFREVAEAEGLICQLVVPIRLGTRIAGLLYVDRRAPRPFTDRDEALLVRLADHAAIAIRNARLFAARARAEDALRESQQTLRAVIDAMPVMINAKDRESRYIFMNSFQARIYGITPDTAIGRTASELLDAAYGGYTEELDRKVMASGEALPYFEEAYPDARGTVHTWLTTKVPLWDAAGQVRGVATIALDLSDRKQLEAELRQAQKMEAIGRLAGGVAHDFNNLLTVIAGRGELLRHRLPADSPLIRHADLILKTAERAAALTQQLLAFSRKQVLQPKLVDLAAVVHGTEKILRRLIGEDVELHTVAGAGLGVVRADPGQIEQVILNLAVNARDAMPDGGRLVLETANVTLDEAFVRQHAGARAGRYVVLSVSDTGAGMTPEVQAHLFEPFFTTKGVGKGTGLGLATVYGIVKQSGGYITVDSEPGRGARFDIYLPRIEGASPDRDDAPTPEPRPGRETILLVEDQTEVRDLARDILHGSGYTVLEARNGAEALQLWDQHGGAVELILTDVVMPQMGGRELADRLLAARPGLRVLYMSGYTDDTLGREGVLDPARAYLPKPFSSASLLRRVRDVLDAAASTT
jgi:PAS domain S-box-containing protein